MLRSMFSAVSGLRNHQAFMDVVGNNIANINTVGFKQSRVTFQDILSQTMRGATAPTLNRGGINPMQIGMGSVLAGTDTLFTQGNLQSTGKLTDLAIQGDGFFILADGQTRYFTRDGNFDIDLNGDLVNPATGLKVLGWQADEAGNINTTDPIGPINIPVGRTVPAKVTSNVSIGGNLNAVIDSFGPITQTVGSGGSASLTGVFNGSSTTSYTVTVTNVDALGNVTDILLDDGTTSTAISGSGGTFNLGNGLTLHIATRPTNSVGDTYTFQAYPPKPASATVEIYDSLGVTHQLTVTFTPQGNNTWSWTVTSNDASVTSITQTPNPATISFSPTGNYTGPTPAGTLNITLANGNNLTVALDLSKITQRGLPTDLKVNQDGYSAGSLVTFNIGSSGEIVGVFSNGVRLTLGQVALANFANPGGLMKEGNNMYSATGASGDPQVGTPNTGGRGSINAGFLEMSNVDLAQQFTNMIMAERGFQANSRVITASDEMLQDLVNIKR